MKLIWTIVSTLALANLLGIIGLVMWLKATDRLDGERVQKLREILAMPITEEKAKAAVAATEAQVKEKAHVEEAKRTGPTETAAEALDGQRDKEEAKQAQMLRLREEIKQLQAALQKQKFDLDNERLQVDDLKKKLEAKQIEISKTGGTEQFKLALAALESQKAPAARQVLVALIGDGKREEALTYLANMDAGKRSKIMTEFIKSDEKLAAELLESLRTRGVEAPTRPQAQAPTP